MLGIIKYLAANLMQYRRAFFFREFNVGFGDTQSFQCFAATHTTIAKVDANGGSVYLYAVRQFRVRC